MTFEDLLAVYTALKLCYSQEKARSLFDKLIILIK